VSGSAPKFAMNVNRRFLWRRSVISARRKTRARNLSGLHINSCERSRDALPEQPTALINQNNKRLRAVLLPVSEHEEDDTGTSPASARLTATADAEKESAEIAKIINYFRKGEDIVLQNITKELSVGPGGERALLINDSEQRRHFI